MIARDQDPSLGPFDIAAIFASVAFIAAGIVMPQAAELLLRLLLATLALGYVAARAYEARLPKRLTQQVYSPLGDHEGTRKTAAAPMVVRDLASQLGEADDLRAARRSPIPRKVRWTLIDEASRRLAERHRLALEDRDDHATIRSLVSEPTWSLIRPGAASAGGRSVPLSQLHTIIDDLEKL